MVYFHNSLFSKSLNSITFNDIGMIRLNVYLSDEAHDIIAAYQKKYGHKTRDAATDAFILEKGKE